MMPAPDENLDRFLIERGLARADEPQRWTVLSGGVSSDIWRADLPGRSLCIKRALAKLRVAAEWYAPVVRNATEWDWFETVAGICPDWVPKLVAHDPSLGLFAMEYLPPESYPLWKARLLAGEVDVAFAASVGRALGRIHAATAGNAKIAARFSTDKSFHALRLEPYLLATGTRHPDLRKRFIFLVQRTAATHHVLVHGDVSPKNILSGARGPVFLDAETAWYGDPAFDLAFCLNHLALKAIVRPNAVEKLEASFGALCDSYLAHVAWEPCTDLKTRAADLLPALMLARIDGKSPVEYLDPRQQDIVRAFAVARLKDETLPLDAFYAEWRRRLASG